MTFYLGSHNVTWLSRTDHPLFISRRRLAMRKSLPRALGRWALDSGGFTELALHGRYETTPGQYATEAMAWSDRIGSLDFAATQDWMCEAGALEKTRLSIREHQERSVESYLMLAELAPGVPWIPVIQGWGVDDYLACVDLYQSAGIPLQSLPLVGVGSVCRRQDTHECVEIFWALRKAGLNNLHGFGLKLDALRSGLGWLSSSDSMAWSYAARKRNERRRGCTHQNCGNCMLYALDWVQHVHSAAARPSQLYLIA